MIRPVQHLQNPMCLHPVIFKGCSDKAKGINLIKYTFISPHSKFLFPASMFADLSILPFFVWFLNTSTSFSDNTVFQHPTQRLIQYQHQNKIADSVDHIKRDSRHPPCKCSMDSPDKQIGNRAHRPESKTERFLPFYSSNIIYSI